MRAKQALFVFILVVFTALSATAASIKGEVVTNVAPALSATMALTGGDGSSCYYWTVSGKVRPEFRGPGANVHLVCTQYNALITGPAYPLVFGAPRCTEDYCPPGNVDACGNFTFTAAICPMPQLDPSYVCNFIVHVDGPQSPQSCNDPHEGSVTGGLDPNGTAPCAGGLCPGSN